MYQVTLKSSARKTTDHGTFTNKDVATHVASTLTGFEDAVGVVTEVTVYDYSTVEEYEAAQAEAKEVSEVQAWAELYNGLTQAQQVLFDKMKAASTAVNTSDPQIELDA